MTMTKRGSDRVKHSRCQGRVAHTYICAQQVGLRWHWHECGQGCSSPTRLALDTRKRTTLEECWQAVESDIDDTMKGSGLIKERMVRSQPKDA